MDLNFETESITIISQEENEIIIWFVDNKNML